MSRRYIVSGSPFEAEIGFSRAVRAGAFLAVAGTAPIAEDGGVACPGDVYGQTRRCIEIAQKAVEAAGLALSDTVRTRIMLVDIGRWREAARAHAEFFRSVKPACTFVQVGGFIDPGWLVEIEMDCYRPAPVTSR